MTDEYDFSAIFLVVDLPSEGASNAKLPPANSPAKIITSLQIVSLIEVEQSKGGGGMSKKDFTKKKVTVFNVFFF